MKRLVFISLSTAILLAAAPAATLARSHKHSAHHKRHHVRHHKIRPSSSGPAVPSPGTPTTTTGSTVVSFTNGVLTIGVTGGTVSAQVTNETDLECEAAETTETENSAVRHDEGGGESGETCTTADLKPGTPVSEAELKISNGAAVWAKVELTVAPSHAPTSTP